MTNKHKYQNELKKIKQELEDIEAIFANPKIAIIDKNHKVYEKIRDLRVRL